MKLKSLHVTMDFPERGEGCFSHTRCPKDYDSPRGLCIGQISDFPRVCGLLRQLQGCLLQFSFNSSAIYYALFTSITR